MKNKLDGISNNLIVSAALKIPFMLFCIFTDRAEIAIFFLGEFVQTIWVGVMYFDWFKHKAE